MIGFQTHSVNSISKIKRTFNFSFSIFIYPQYPKICYHHQNHTWTILQKTNSPPSTEIFPLPIPLLDTHWPKTKLNILQKNYFIYFFQFFFETHKTHNKGKILYLDSMNNFCRFVWKCRIDLTATPRIFPLIFKFSSNFQKKKKKTLEEEPEKFPFSILGVFWKYGSLVNMWKLYTSNKHLQKRSF